MNDIISPSYLYSCENPDFVSLKTKLKGEGVLKLTQAEKDLAKNLIEKFFDEEGKE